MKKILLLLLLLGGFVQAQNVIIPDAGLKAKLLSANAINNVASGTDHVSRSIDTNNDGEIQVSEALTIAHLDLRSSSLTDLTGIENFTNLTVLYCDYNQLTSLNISGLASLEYLSCSHNQLGILNLTGLVSLEDLICNNNSLTALNVAGLSGLKNVNCSINSLGSLNISSLTGLLHLNCEGNPLAALNVSNSVGLVSLKCGGTPLNALDVSALVNLENLEFTNSSIGAIDLGTLVNLKNLSCGSNGLTAIDLSALVNLESLFLYNNQLTTLDLTGLTQLKKLSCSSNLFTTLNVNFLTNLTELIYGNTGLADVDVSNLVNLNTFGYYGGTHLPPSLVNFPNLENLAVVATTMTTLDVSDLTRLKTFTANGNLSLNFISLKHGGQFNTDEIYFIDNPNLTFVCTNEADITSATNGILTGNGAIVVNSYCNFIPGGNYNTITGNMLFDANNNGCDASDSPQSNIKIKLNDGVSEGAAFTNTTGNYTFFTETGNFNITPDVENPAWFNFAPPSAVIPFANDNNNTAIQNFCITANGIHPDLEIVIAPIVPARPGFDAVYKIVYKNKGNQTLSQLYGINFFYNHHLMNFVAASTPVSSSNMGSLSWDYASLMPFESRSITVTMHINAPTDANPVNIGEVLQLTASVLTVADENNTDNLFQLNQIVVGSFDPNDKLCLEGKIVSPVKIGEYLHYVINFENTGTASAVNVVVKDVIDTAQFDEKTLQILDTSHPVTAKIAGNNAEFSFQNINLEQGGHGNILLKVKTRDNLSDGDVVVNKANIFFDYNFPIETDEARTTFQALSVDEHEIDLSLSVYPNPTNGVLNISSKSNMKSIHLYDIQGRLLQTKILSANHEVLDLTTQSAGVYFVKIFTEVGYKLEKVIRE